MPFSSTAPELRIELHSTGGVYSSQTEATTFTGEVLLRLHKSTSVQGVRLEFVGEETVNLRAWVPLSSSTVSREIVRESKALHSGGLLSEGTHVFAFQVVVPGWVPSTMESEVGRIRYVVRAVVERSSLGAYFSSSAKGSGVLAREAEVECVKRRRSKRLARLKQIDQSVGCPDGSCHVRFWGSISRDVVRPGAQLKINVVAKTSDARYGLKLLVANFAECVMCHVQVKGEERLTKKITNLLTCRLDSLSGGDEGDGEEEEEEEVDVRAQRHSEGAEARGGSDVEAAGSSRLHVPLTVRKTRSRLAVLLGSSSPSVSPQSTTVAAADAAAYSSSTMRSAPPMPSLPASSSNNSSAQQQSQPPTATATNSGSNLSPTSAACGTSGSSLRKLSLGSRRTMPGALNSPGSMQSTAGGQRRVVRQIRASRVIQIPQHLSQFASEYISRDYRLMLIAEVAPMSESPVNANSIHTSRSSVPATPRNTTRELTPEEARELEESRVNGDGTRKSVSSMSTASSAEVEMKHQEQLAQQRMRERRRWTVSEKASAIAGWKVEVVDQFDVLFDELVAPQLKSSNNLSRTLSSHTMFPARSSSDQGPSSVPPVTQSVRLLQEPAITVGEYQCLPPSTAGAAAEGGAATPSDSGSLSTDGESVRTTSNSRQHHRRTSSGLVGFLMRGFRSSTSSPSASPKLDNAQPPQTSNNGSRLQRKGSRHHVRSGSSGVVVAGPAARNARSEMVMDAPHSQPPTPVLHTSRAVDAESEHAGQQHGLLRYLPHIHHSHSHDHDHDHDHHRHRATAATAEEQLDMYENIQRFPDIKAANRRSRSNSVPQQQHLLSMHQRTPPTPTSPLSSRSRQESVPE
ncbi:hypothetical protein GQ54DRAFT_300674 [Martensiomyces pterosporus]|nr:hypothetical protein GQ54DRAFT_300674 [Martensiomyces pterosporus]